MLPGTDVRQAEICKSHVQASLLHHLLFGPTLSVEERRAGETGRQEMVCRPWFVTVLHQIPGFFFSPVCDSRCPLTISKGPGSELDESWFSHKGKFGQSAEFASTALCLDFFFLLQFLWTWVVRLRAGWIHRTWPLLFCAKNVLPAHILDIHKLSLSCLMFILNATINFR